ncbi:MAG TPA: histidinol-phosphatase [Treponema sp.]|nr:histidinol-phosphatase [Treponema sp.]
MKYLYETHLHTIPASACAASPGADYIRVYQDLGYTGIIVTDHFCGGNTAIPQNLPWREWINRFCQGYEDAKEEGDRQGFDVFFGWEETFDGGDDYLIYGLDKAWLLEHPEARNWTRGEQYRAVKEAGGCVVQAHPFRQHFYIDRVILSTGCVDAVEVANAGNNEQSYDALAMRYARRLGLPVTAGSDIHVAEQARERYTFGIYLDKKLNNIGDFVTAIRDNQISGLRFSQGRCDYHGGETVSIPVEVRDINDRVINKNLKELI